MIRSVKLGAVLALAAGSAAVALPVLVAPDASPRAPRQDALYQVPYNGRFTFTRVRYGPAEGRGFGRGWRSAWNHDYPNADRNMQFILERHTGVAPNTGGSNVVDLEDPRIFEHPILYMSEPGYWWATEEGIANLRTYLLKGGFLIFDDFEREQWNNMATEVGRALPGHRWIEIDESHPIFRSYFRVDDIYVPHPLVRVTPNYRAIFEENDPTGRMMVLANHNFGSGRVLGVVAGGVLPGRSDERRLPSRGQLHRLRDDALTGGTRGGAGGRPPAPLPIPAVTDEKLLGYGTQRGMPAPSKKVSRMMSLPSGLIE